MSVRISAVVCTHNRAGYLRKAIQSLVDQTLDQGAYEIIVVDNGSQDNTKEVVNDFSHLPNLRYLSEPIIGLSRARNTGWRNAEGVYVAYLDDDAVASLGWLAKFIDVFEGFKPCPGVIGGRVEPIWEAPRPEWLSDKLLAFLSIVHWSDVPIVLNEEQWLPACNIAYPRELLQRVGGFREDLDRQGAKLLSSGEIYLQKQSESLGYRTLYHPEIAVDHHLSPERLTKRWFKERVYWQGVSNALMSNTQNGTPLPLRAWLAVRRLGWSVPRLFLMLTATNSRARFRRQCQLLEAMGYISGLWRWPS